MIPKAGKDLKQPSNHRPIFLLNSLSKVFKTLMLNRFKLYSTPKIRQEQFGFRPHHSTTLQLVNVINDLAINVNRGWRTAAVLLDVEQAFDNVWLECLIFKLIQMEISGQIINIIASILSNGTFQVKKENSLSSISQAQAGVPQGSSLSPHIFLVLINDMPHFWNAKTALFTDDMLFYVCGKTNNATVNKFQTNLNLTVTWFQISTMENHSQSDQNISHTNKHSLTLAFTNKQLHKITYLSLKKRALNWSFSFNYLGVTIDKNLKFAKQIKSVLNKVKATVITYQKGKNMDP